MKRTLVVLLAALLLSVPTQAHDWSKVAYRLSQATARLVGQDGETFCSGFSIDNKRDYLLTASHCVHSSEAWGRIRVDGLGTVLVADRPEVDVAVLGVEGMDRPELKPRTDWIRVGMEIGSFGFAREAGLFSHFRAGNVAGIGSVEDFDGIWIITDQPISGGMSGGPIVDTDGRVVTVNQRSDRTFSAIGRDIGAIYRETSEYWRK